MKKNNQNNEPGPWKRIGDIFWSLKPILFSHHPLCERFKNHSFNFLGQKFCIGCFIGYPSSIIMLVLGYLGIFSFFNTSTLWISGFILYTIYIIYSISSSEKIIHKILSKIFIGTGTAFIVAGIFSLQLQFWAKLTICFVLITTILIFLTWKRLRYMKKTCKECEYESDQNNCPGMGIINKNLSNIGYIMR